jgi:hypothetical protein
MSNQIHFLKNVALLAFLLANMATFSLSAQNASCDQGKKIAENTWEKWGPWKPNISLVPFKNGVKQLRQHWNWIASNGVGTVGPRRLEINDGSENGTILGQTQRTFVTHPAFEDNVKVKIDKTDGRAATSVVICTHSQNGIMQNIVSYEFPNNKDAQSKVFNIPNARGKIIIVAMRNKSVGNKFTYTIKAD